MKTIKSRQNFLNESNTIDCRDYFKDKDLSVIPLDSNLEETPEVYNGIRFKSFEYFGNCVNTVPKIWDATQMSHVCLKSKLYDINLVLDNIKSGDKEIPKSLMKHLNSENVENLEEVVCAINEYQKIMFIYVTKLDKHFFFDCFK